MTDNRTTERVDHPPRVREAIDELMREKDANDNRTTELLPCPFCGGEAALHPTYDMDTGDVDGWFARCDNDTCECKQETGQFLTESEAIAAWNNRTPIEYEGWFYLPKPKEGIVDYGEPAITRTENGYKVRQIVDVVDEAARKWGEELGEYVMHRICEIWNSRAERTCKQEERGWGTEGDHAIGNGTLTAEQVREAIERHSVWVIGNNRCFHDGAYEEIANELNSRAERNVASFCTNVKTCTLEDVLREFTEKYQYCISDNGRSITLAKYTDEIRELLGVGE